MKKNSISNIVIAGLLGVVIVIGVFQLINNGLNSKYQIDPFAAGGDILELKRISETIIENNSQTLIIMLALTILNSIVLSIKYLNNK